MWKNWIQTISIYFSRFIHIQIRKLYKNLDPWNASINDRNEIIALFLLYKENKNCQHYQKQEHRMQYHHHMSVNGHSMKINPIFIDKNLVYRNTLYLFYWWLQLHRTVLNLITKCPFPIKKKYLLFPICKTKYSSCNSVRQGYQILTRDS